MEKSVVETEVRSIVTAIPDPLHGNHRRHHVHDMLFASIISVICGFSNYRCFEKFVGLNLAWLRQHGCIFANGVPDGNSFQYLFAHLDPGLPSACLRSVAGRLRERTGMEIVSFDGKALRFLSNVQVCKCASGQCAVFSFQYQFHACSVDGTGTGAHQCKLPACTLANLHTEGNLLEGRIVTIDAMGCQKKIVKQIFAEKKAHYVIALKDNQKTFHEEMLLLFEKELETGRGLFKKSAAVTEKSHGRIEKRTCHQTDYIGWFQDKNEWIGLKSVIMVVSERTVWDVESRAWKTSAEKRLYISSLPADPDLALKAVRTHWGIENRLHWTLDVTFGEDHCRARVLHAAENRATVLRIGVNLLNRYARMHGCGTKMARMMANQSKEALEEMVAC